MLYGSSPFLGDSKHETFANITAASFDFDDTEVEVSPEGRDFITRCLRKDIRKRITAKEALAHPWMSKVEHMDIDSALISSSFNSSPYDEDDLHSNDDEITFDVVLKTSSSNKVVDRPSSLGNSSSGTPTNGSTTPTSTTSVISSNGSSGGDGICNRSSGRSSSCDEHGEPKMILRSFKQHSNRQRWKVGLSI